MGCEQDSFCVVWDESQSQLHLACDPTTRCSVESMLWAHLAVAFQRLEGGCLPAHQLLSPLLPAGLSLSSQQSQSQCLLAIEGAMPSRVGPSQESQEHHQSG